MWEIGIIQQCLKANYLLWESLMLFLIVKKKIDYHNSRIGKFQNYMTFISDLPLFHWALLLSPFYIWETERCQLTDPKSSENPASDSASPQEIITPIFQIWKLHLWVFCALLPKYIFFYNEEVV